MTYHSRRRRRSLGMFLVAIGVLLAIGVGTGIMNSAYDNSKRQVIVHVEDKDRVCHGGDGDCKYLVYTDKGTFKVTDSHTPWFWRTNSSDVYGHIKRDHNYRFEVIGFRNGLFSNYPNVTKVYETISIR